ncbi:MAG: glycoside hydrolase family 3 C-terminal domain-containing protein [Clostridiales bacterium]|nr:glycoside hydrolase family 3 C-terminal domain-containing protein [Clostridiales bacterium]
MKNEKIIQGMTEKQKLSLLTDSKALNAPWLDTLGVPRLSVADYSALTKDSAVPSLDILASSFDFALVREIGKLAAENGAAKGVNFVVSPDISVDLSAGGKGFSEDPYLCGMLGSALLSGFKGAGCSAAVSDLSIRETDFDYTDVNLKDTVLHDFFLKSIEFASASSDCDAIVSSEAVTDEGSEVGRLERLYFKNVNPDIPHLIDSATAEGTVASVNGGAVMCLNGSAVAISAALDNYRKMRQGVDDGSVTITELEKAVKAGSAISEKTVNEAVDSVINFLFECSMRRKPAEEKTRDELLEYVYARTAVLLKNAAALPLVKGQRVATIGPLPKSSNFTTVFAEACKKSGVVYIGHAEGYELNSELGGGLVAGAASLAHLADVTIVFLDEPEGNSTLSANRLEILNTVNKKKSKTIAVCINRAIDLDIDGQCDAIMLAALNGRESEEALSKLLLGKVSPSGKLAKTIYRDRTGYYNEVIRKDRQSDKIGRYLGYRMYDAAGITEMYPFGHGLTYSQIKYSGLKLKGNELTFTIQNKGKYFVTETVEVYIGKKSSALSVPKKELKFIACKGLKPHEKALISIRLDYLENSLSVYDSIEGQSALEAGEYDVYIGRSLFDIRLQTTFTRGGKKFVPESSPTPTIFKSSTNIHSGSYKLNDNRTESTKNPVQTIFILTTVIAVLAGIALPLIAYYQPDMAMLSYILLGAVGGLWLIVLITFIVITVKRRNNMRLRAARTTFDEEQWDLETLSDVLPLTELFADMESFSGEKRVRAKKTVRTDYDKSQYIDQTATFDAVCARYVSYLKGSGVSISAQKAKAVLSSLASSRLLVLRNSDKNLIRLFTSATSRFFGTPEFFADARGYKVAFDLFADYNGIKSAVAFAEREPHKMTFVTMDGVDMKSIRSYFTPLIAGFANINHPHTLDIKNSIGEKVTYVIPPNMWFFLTESSPVNAPLPAFVTDLGSVIDLQLSSVPAGGRPADSDGIPYEQYVWMTDATRNALDFDEAHWKKIDKLEEYVRSQAGEYSISNKKWGKLERFVSVYCACGDENTDIADAMREALDHAISVNLIHGMVSVLIGKHSGDAPSLIDTVDHALGQDYDNETEGVLKVYNAEGISR